LSELRIDFSQQIYLSDARRVRLGKIGPSGLGQLKIRVPLFAISSDERVHSSFCRHGGRHEYQEVHR
jgi:hypothetical protein